MYKLLGAVLVIALGLAVLAVYWWGKRESAPAMSEPGVSSSAAMKEKTIPADPPSPYREFVLESRAENGKAWFSLNEIKVKKGELVHVVVKNTKGDHDFAIDDYKIKRNTPLNEDTVFEFTADKTGTFEFYCSKHRAQGQVGKLIVE